MKSLAKEVLSEAKALGFPVAMLGRSDVISVKSIVLEKYDLRDFVRIWENLKEQCSVQDSSAWEWIDEFIAGNEAIMFFDEEDDGEMVLFSQGASVVPVIRECTGFEFYLTNQSGEFLLCFNHHDFLIGAGSAEDWIRARSA